MALDIGTTINALSENTDEALGPSISASGDAPGEADASVGGTTIVDATIVDATVGEESLGRRPA